MTTHSRRQPIQLQLWKWLIRRNTQTARHCRSYLQSNIISFKNEVVFVALTRNPLKREKYIKDAQKYLLKLPRQNSLYHSKRKLDPKRKSYKITISPQSMSNFFSCITTHRYIAFRTFSVDMTNLKISIGFIPKPTLKCPLSGPSGILYQLEL